MSRSLDIRLYEAIIRRIALPRGLARIPGDILEVGAFMGGGTRILAEYAVTAGKRVWAVDCFDAATDPSVNSAGRSMESIYRACLNGGQSAYEVFSGTVAGLPNIDVFKGDSRTLRLPDSPLCFAFIDGGHSEDCVANDFDLAWRRLSPGGVMAFHDFGGDLPQVTATVNRCIDAVRGEVSAVGTFPEQWMIWIEKSGRPTGPEASAADPPLAGTGFRMAVASCGEDLSWTRLVGGPVTIYDASGSAGFPGAVPVENRAREAGQYLFHIIRNYPFFHDWEIFVQGNPFAHSADPVLRGGAFDWSWGPFQPLGNVVGFDPRGCEHDRWAARFATEWMGGVPAGMHWVVGAQFGVHRKLLLNRPLDYWQSLREKVLGEEGSSPWAMERLWMALV